MLIWRLFLVPASIFLLDLIFSEQFLPEQFTLLVTLWLERIPLVKEFWDGRSRLEPSALPTTVSYAEISNSRQVPSCGHSPDPSPAPERNTNTNDRMNIGRICLKQFFTPSYKSVYKSTVFCCRFKIWGIKNLLRKRGRLKMANSASPSPTCYKFSSRSFTACGENTCLPAYLPSFLSVNKNLL